MIFTNKAKGVLFGAVAAATYGMNPLFALPLYQNGFDADSVLFYRYTVAALILGVGMAAAKRSFTLNRWELVLSILGGLTFACSSLTLFLAYHYMEASIASTLLFIYPVMVALIMALFFKEKLTLITVFSIVFALCGIGMLYKGEEGAVLNLTGCLFVFLSALAYAIYIVGVKKTVLRDLPCDKLTLYALVFGIPVFLLRKHFGMDLHPITNWTEVGLIFASGFLPTIVSLLCTAMAIRYVGPTPTAILGALEPLTAVFFGVLLFGEHFTLRLGAGILLIITAVLLIVAGVPLLDALRKIIPKLKAHLLRQ